MLKSFACVVLLLSAFPALAQNTPKSIALTDKSNVPTKDISKALRKRGECQNVSVADDVTKSDYTLEAIKKTDPQGSEQDSFQLSDSAGKTVRSASSLKEICQAINKSIIVEVVDTQNLTQSVDARGTGNPATIEGGVVNLTGRRTLTDSSTIAVIVNGERALLDCFERRKGCITVAPGKYYGELDFGSIHGVGGIWIQFEMPLTHEQVRNHYKIAGSW